MPTSCEEDKLETFQDDARKDKCAGIGKLLARLRNCAAKENH